MGRTGRGTQHHQVDGWATSTTHSPSTRRRWSSGATCWGAARAVRRPSHRRGAAPSPPRALRDRARRWSGWRRYRLPRAARPVGPGCDRLVSRSLRDAVLALGLGQLPPLGRSLPAAPRPAAPHRAASGWLPGARRRLRGPSITSAVTSSPRWAGRQWSTTASGRGQSQQRVVDGVAGEGARRRGSASSSWPIEVHTSV